MAAPVRRLALLVLASATAIDALKISALRGGRNVKMSAAAAEKGPNADYFSNLDALTGVYSFAHPGGEFDVHLRDKGKFWAPKFQCKSTWVLQSDGGLLVDFQQFGMYEFKVCDDGTFSGSAVGKPDNWRKMRKLRSFSAAETAVMDSRWLFEHNGGSFEVELRADAFNHFVCEAYPAHSHWRLDNADSATPTLYINWGKFGEYELEVAADGASASGSVKGRPADWRKMTLLGALGTNLKQYVEHDH